MFSPTSRRNRRSSFGALIALTTLVGIALLAPDRARAQQQREHEHAAASDTAVAGQIERTTAHLEQMLGTLRDNPSLEESWSGPGVLGAAVAAGRGSSGVAREVEELSATLDSLLESEAARRNDDLARNLRRMERSTQSLVATLRDVADELEAVRGVTHGEGGHVHPAGEGHSHGGGARPGHHDALHFSHPMFTESVSPDTKVRMDYSVADVGPDAGTKQDVGLTLEYALGPGASIEAGVPYGLTDGALGFTSVSLKLVNDALEEQGISLGYGMGVTLPTSGDVPLDIDHRVAPDAGLRAARGGRARVIPSPPPARAHGGGLVHSSLGEDFYQFEPFLNIGWKTGRWELVGFTTFEIPSGVEEQHEVGSTLAWDVSALLHAAPEAQAILELNGRSGVSGHPAGEDVVNVAPGVKLRPSAGSPVWLGVGGSFPITADRGYDGRLMVSLFYHFGGHGH